MKKSCDILDELVSYLSISKAELAAKVGYERPQAFYDVMSGKTKKISPTMVDRIISVYPEISHIWLLTGEGEMLKNTSETANNDGSNAVSGKIIPFYDADAVAGYDYAVTMEPAKQVGMIEIGSILKDSEAGIRVYGNSMVPNYPAGCVIGTKLHTDSFIEPGRVYIVETRDNRYLKRLYYNDDKTAFHCISDNQMKYDDGPRKGKLYYQDFEIPADEVVRIHQVVGVIKRNIM